MKLHILSDLHNEFQPHKPADVDADAIILAGDVDLGLRGIDWIERHFAEKPVIYVSGNHEYYRQALPKLTQKLKSATAGSHIHFLENDSFKMNDVIFLGCTLWTDFDLFGNYRIAQHEAAQRMNDYRLIRISPKYRRLNPETTSRLHFQSVKFLKDALKANSDQKIVVVTHHAPSIKSVPASYRSELIAAAYASDLETLIQENNIAFWIHGHLHESTDYRIDTTRILSNPAGYPEMRNQDFIPDLVVEV
ncbi:phosphoesterase [candidate division KSB1 bacterium]|nr:phosphoesterase [candidate division KSB1 bacterium]